MENTIDTDIVIKKLIKEAWIDGRTSMSNSCTPTTIDKAWKDSSTFINKYSKINRMDKNKETHKLSEIKHLFDTLKARDITEFFNWTPVSPEIHILQKLDNMCNFRIDNPLIKRIDNDSIIFNIPIAIILEEFTNFFIIELKSIRF